MAYLIDTNLLLRHINVDDPQHRVAVNALKALRRVGEPVCIVPQNVYEFWYVCTRSVARNGLGMSVEETSKELTKLETLFLILPDEPAIYWEWKRLMEAYNVTGAASHDARLVAAMKVHQIDHILTFNVADFARFPKIVIISPQDIGTEG